MVFQLLNLVDPWRLMHPGERDYTFSSPMHHSHTRIDFFLIQHRDLSLVTSSQIDIIAFSDHAPVHVTLELEISQSRSLTWSLNESLLQLPEVRKEIDCSLATYFSENAKSMQNPISV